jgi:hypothetical protein
MEETLPLSPLSSDPSLTELIARLENQVIASMDVLVAHLQSLHQESKLDKETLKDGIKQVLSLAQGSLLIQTLPFLLTPSTMKGSLQTADLFKKVQQTAESLKAIGKDQMMQAIDSKAAKILEQIQTKEQQIREQIAKKQQEVVQIVQDKMKARQAL